MGESIDGELRVRKAEVEAMNLDSVFRSVARAS
jgi:hypothetical protein